MKRLSLLLGLLLALMAAACGSGPPTHFYTLDAVPPAHPAHGKRTAPVQVRNVAIPAVLDRLAFVHQIGADRVQISDQARWAAPLDASIRQVVSADLRARLPPGTVLAPGAPQPEGTRVLELTITRFMGDADGRVTLECDWSLLESRTRKILAQRHERLTEQAGSGSADAAVPTMSRLLVTFSDRIACGSHDPSALVSGSTPP